MARADHPPLHCLRLYQEEKKKDPRGSQKDGAVPPQCLRAPPGSLPSLGPPAPSLGVSKTRWDQRDVPDPVRWIGDLPRSLVPKLGSGAWGGGGILGGHSLGTDGFGSHSFLSPSPQVSDGSAPPDPAVQEGAMN